MLHAGGEHDLSEVVALDEAEISHPLKRIGEGDGREPVAVGAG